MFITVTLKSLPSHLLQGDRFARGPVDCEGHVLRYVTDTMKFGSTVSEADSYAFNLDNDPNNVPDNALGHVLAGLSSQLHVDTQVAAAINSGKVVTLDTLDMDSLRQGRHASWHVYLGKPQAHPVLTGGGSFAVDPGAPASTGLTGSVKDGRFTGGPGTMPVRLGLVAGQPPIELHLIGARIQANCDAAGFGCTNGKLGGGIATAEVDAVIIPALAAIFQASISPACTAATPDSCTQADHQILDLFDTNHDYVITADEVRANALIQAILQPDLDLLDAHGHPGHDGVKDSLSVGLGFTAKYAVFS